MPEEEVSHFPWGLEKIFPSWKRFVDIEIVDRGHYSPLAIRHEYYRPTRSFFHFLWSESQAVERNSFLGQESLGFWNKIKEKGMRDGIICFPQKGITLLAEEIAHLDRIGRFTFLIPSKIKKIESFPQRDWAVWDYILSIQIKPFMGQGWTDWVLKEPVPIQDDAEMFIWRNWIGV